MKFKQILLIMGISAFTAVGSVWTYNKFNDQEVVLGSNEKGLPVNYAGFFDGKIASAEGIDLTKAAAGIYFYSVTLRDGSVAKGKLIVEN